jgi:MoxR-like ATPase
MDSKIITIVDAEGAPHPEKIDVGFIAELENETIHQIGKALVGYEDLKRLSARCLFTNSNILVVSVPGLGKTVLIMALGEVIGGSIAVTRQFVSDLMPSDIIGTEKFNEKTGDFDMDYGPLVGDTELIDGVLYSMVHIFGADEINRANPKMQSALLGAMQEKRVMIGKNVIRMPSLFSVLATRNPIENEGTYDLPEAQLDRFAVEKLITYLPRADRKRLAMTPATRLADVHKLAKPATDVATVLAVQKYIHENIFMSEALIDYIIDLTGATRPGSEEFDKYLKSTCPAEAEAVQWGVSERAVQSFQKLAQAGAAANKRMFVKPNDVRLLAEDVLCHRALRTPIAKATGEVTIRQIVKAIVNNVPVNEDDMSLYDPSLGAK